MTKKKDTSKWPTAKGAKGPTSIPVKYDPHMGLFAPQVKKARATTKPKKRRSA